MHKQTIAITATFTAEPIEESFVFWMRELSIPSGIEFAPYNQLFQQLLDPASLLSKNQHGINVILVRFEDWGKLANGEGAEAEFASDTDEKIERDVRDFVLALREATKRSATPHLVCLCPASMPAAADPNLVTFFKRMEELIRSEAKDMKGVHLVTAAEISATYPVTAYDDPHADKLGHVPYTQAFFAALGTILARKIYSLRGAPHKVIALDCDQTLWKGVCGEDGPQGVEIDPPHRALQEFMVAQHHAGMLVCLCSKNNAEDVVKVFEQRAEMPLKRDHIVSWRLNWRPKSENMKALAEELRLGLDSFIFVDDDPVACAEVRANCPEVLTLQLPQEAGRIPRFLDHVWAFDHLKITGEDENRTALYRQNVERERSRKGSLNFEDFLASLGLKVQISEMRPHHLTRVSQLTHRTNQFNFTTIRRSEGEVQTLCQTGNSECLVVEVSDRFGDYGLVGVIIFRAESEAVNVDTFLLSCRALGRGVEHQMLARLGEIVRERGSSHINVRYVASGKNQPALDFLDGVGTEFKQPTDGGYFFRFPVEFAATLTYRPGGEEPESSSRFADKPSALSADHSANGTAAKSALLGRIAAELCTAEQVLNVIESQKQRSRPESEGVYVAPRTPLEEMLAGIWAQTLSLDGVGVHDNFFQMGGHSLLGTLLMSRIADAFQMELSLRDLFESPTVAGMAQIIKQGQIEQSSAQEIAAALRELNELSDEEVMALLADEEEMMTDREKGEVGDGMGLNAREEVRP